MAENQAAMAKRDEKKRLEKEAATAIYLNLTKEVIQVQGMDVEVNEAYAEAKFCDPGRGHKIMLADLRNMATTLGPDS
jgi:hypothetical protein